MRRDEVEPVGRHGVARGPGGRGRALWLRAGASLLLVLGPFCISSVDDGLGARLERSWERGVELLSGVEYGTRVGRRVGRGDPAVERGGAVGGGAGAAAGMVGGLAAGLQAGAATGVAGGPAGAALLLCGVLGLGLGAASGAAAGSELGARIAVATRPNADSRGGRKVGKGSGR